MGRNTWRMSGSAICALLLSATGALAQDGRDVLIDSIDDFDLEEVGSFEATDGSTITLEVGVGSVPDLPDEPLAVFFLASDRTGPGVEPVGMLTYDEASQFSISLAFLSLIAVTTRDAETLPRTLEHWITIGMDEGAGVQLGLVTRPVGQELYLSLNGASEEYTTTLDVAGMEALQALLDTGLSRVETLLGLTPLDDSYNTQL